MTDKLPDHDAAETKSPELSDLFFTTERRIEFVKFVKQKSKTDGLSKAIRDFGAGSEQAFHTWQGLIDHTEREVLDGMENNQSQGKMIQLLRPGTIYMAVGVLAMVVGALIYRQLPAPFVFVTMVLGIAVFLYGTGTHAVGDVTRNTSGAEAIKANVRIAGGAGVMALIVGAGLIFGGERMQRTFVESTQYSKAIVSIAGGSQGSTLLFVQDSFQDRHLARYHDGKIEVIFEHNIGEQPASGCYTFQLQGSEYIHPISVNLRFDGADNVQGCQNGEAELNPTLTRGVYRMTIEQRDSQGNDTGQRFAEGGTPIDIDLDVTNALQ